MTAIWIIAIIALLGICYQDFKYRGVYWWLFPMLMLALGAITFVDAGVESLLKKAGINTLFVLFQILVLGIYFSIRNKRWVNIFNGYFGLGDLLFLLCLTVYFSFWAYLLFYILSIFIVIVAVIVGQLFFKQENPRIPLAGYQAILFMLFTCIYYSFGKSNLSAESILFGYLKF